MGLNNAQIVFSACLLCYWLAARLCDMMFSRVFLTSRVRLGTKANQSVLGRSFRVPVSDKKNTVVDFDSPQFREVTRNLYREAASSRLVGKRLRRYVKARLGGGEHVAVALLQRRLDHCYFSVGTFVTSGRGGLFVGSYREDSYGYRQIIGAEPWVVLSHLFNGAFLFGISPINWVWRRIVEEAVTHELIHLLQDVQGSVFQWPHEQVAQPVIDRCAEYWTIELEAHAFGSPWLITTLGALISGLFACI